MEKSQIILSWDLEGFDLGIGMLRMDSASSLLYRDVMNGKSPVLVASFIRFATKWLRSKVEGFFSLNQGGCWSGILCHVLTFHVHWKSLGFGLCIMFFQE